MLFPEGRAKRDIDSECKQCRSKQRSFVVKGDEDSVVWNAIVGPPDHSEQVQLSESINERNSCRKAAIEKVFSPHGNVARVAHWSVTSAAVDRLEHRSAAGQVRHGLQV